MTQVDEPGAYAVDDPLSDHADLMVTGPWRAAGGAPVTPALLAAELLDLLELGLGQVARHVVAGDLLGLHVVPDSSTISGLASVVTSPTSAKLEIDAMTRRMILPDLVFGMSATIQTFFGRAILPIWSRSPC